MSAPNVVAESPTLAEELFGPAPRILVLRGQRMGDFLSATPALRALRRGLPGATIGLITAPSLSVLAERYPWFDERFIAPPWPGVAEEAGTGDDDVAFFARMRAWRADLALQLNGGGDSSNRFIHRLGARLTAGIRHPDAPDVDLSVPYDPAQPIRRRYLDLLALMGIPIDTDALVLPRLTSDDLELAQALPAGWSLDALGQRRLLGIHPGSQALARRWPIARFAAVADALADEFQLTVVLLGTEAGLGQALAASLRRPDRAIDLTGRTSLGALVALMARLSLFLGNDSGPSHVAEALGTPSVVVYGQSHPLNWAPLSRARHRVVADWTAPCRWFRPCGCSEDSCAPCLQAVSAEQVLAAARGVLGSLARVQYLRHLSRADGEGRPD